MAQKREKYRNNPELYSKRNRENYAKHVSERDAANRRWIKENRERRRRVHREYLQAHPEYVRDSDLRRKARLRASGGNVQRRDRKSFQSATRCIDCLPESTTCAVEIGHLVPVALGGSSRPDNLAPQCADHNTKLGVSVHPKAPLRDVAHATIYVARILINPSTLTKREMLIILRALPSIERYWKIWLNE